MPNYVRACFFLSKSIEAERFYSLFQAIGRQGCTYNVDTKGQVSGYLALLNEDVQHTESDLDIEVSLPKLLRLAEWLAQPSSIIVDLGWRIHGQSFMARLLQIWNGSDQQRLIWFDIEDNVFLPGSAIEFSPGNSEPFETYKHILEDVILHLRPFSGVIDYEADCAGSDRSIISASWGNYVSPEALTSWSTTDLDVLRSVVDEVVPMTPLGLLTFIHPLAANQSWTYRHQQLQKLFDRNPVDSG